jgi:oxygen-independent coproporphyrinogen-3 oxidase
LTAGYVNTLKKLPFNRLSMGIQSFDDDDLQFLNRRHTAREAINAVKRSQYAGFNNISIDLIYGLPRQTVAKWEYNVDMALSLDIQHISAYNLSYEEGTKIFDLKERGAIQSIEDEQNEEFFNMLVAKLTVAGFIHYEISNFARRTSDYPDGILSKHNSSYWNSAHYLGLGVSAHSYNGNTRQWNVASLTKYIKAIQNNEIPCETEFLNARMKYNDFIITRLRTVWGISLSELENLFGVAQKQQFLSRCEKFFHSQMLAYQFDTIRLTPQSLFISDSILRDLIDV